MYYVETLSKKMCTIAVESIIFNTCDKINKGSRKQLSDGLTPREIVSHRKSIVSEHSLRYQTNPNGFDTAKIKYMHTKLSEIFFFFLETIESVNGCVQPQKTWQK